MKVRFGNLWVARGGLEGTFQARWNGVQVNDEANFFRAAAKTYFPRGNRATTFGFTVTRGFDKEADAMVFAATGMNSLPQSGDLIVLADDDTAAVTLAGAVIDSFNISQVIGCCVIVEYSFRGGVFAATDVPEIPDESDDTMKRGTIDLDPDDEEKEITFSTPFAGSPSFVGPTLLTPTGSPGFSIWVNKDDVTNTGFKVKFGAAVPASGYQLNWLAIA